MPPEMPAEEKNQTNPTTNDACGLDYPCPCPLCQLFQMHPRGIDILLLIIMIVQPPHMHKTIVINIAQSRIRTSAISSLAH